MMTFVVRLTILAVVGCGDAKDSGGSPAQPPVPTVAPDAAADAAPASVQIEKVIASWIVTKQRKTCTAELECSYADCPKSRPVKYVCLDELEASKTVKVIRRVDEMDCRIGHERGRVVLCPDLE